jgi:large subunit ribosomal protein L24
MKLRTGDTVLIISGKDKGKSGTITRVLRKDGRVVVAGINMRTKHIKKTFQEAGRKIKYEASIDASKVMIVDPKKQKPSRIGFQMKDGKKMRVSKMSGEMVAKAKPAPKKTEAKKETAKKDKAAETETAPQQGGGKTPFWKRMKFGASAMEQAEVNEGSHMSQDHSLPNQPAPIRKAAGRGK